MPTRARSRELLADALREADGIAQVDVAGPGFLNITVEAGAQGQVAADVVAAGAAYGRNETLAGTRINVEFISANPTGPLHLGPHPLGRRRRRDRAGAGRGRRRGDAGVLHQRPRQPDEPVRRLAGGRGAGPARSRTTATTATTSTTSPARWSRQHPAILDLPDRRAGGRVPGGRLRPPAAPSSRSSSTRSGTHFDVWFSERSLHDERRGRARTSRSCAARGTCSTRTAPCGCARRTSGDDKDRVLIRSDGELTYFASDTAYYLDKRARGFDVCIYLLGADHHGYVRPAAGDGGLRRRRPDVQPRGADRPAGQDPAGRRGAASSPSGPARSSRCEELVDLIGVDALRYSLARYPADSPLILDVAEITKAVQRQPGLLRAVRATPAPAG